MPPYNQMYLDLLQVALLCVQQIMTSSQKLEMAMVHWKADLISRIHGEQSEYGW